MIVAWGRRGIGRIKGGERVGEEMVVVVKVEGWQWRGDEKGEGVWLRIGAGEVGGIMVRWGG